MNEPVTCAWCLRVIPNMLRTARTSRIYHACENPQGTKVALNFSCWALSDYGKNVHVPITQPPIRLHEPCP